MEPRYVLYRCLDSDCGCGLFVIDEETLQFGAEEVAAGSRQAVEAAKSLFESSVVNVND